MPKTYRRDMSRRERDTEPAEPPEQTMTDHDTPLIWLVCLILTATIAIASFTGGLQ